MQCFSNSCSFSGSIQLIINSELLESKKQATIQMEEFTSVIQVRETRSKVILVNRAYGLDNALSSMDQGMRMTQGLDGQAVQTIIPNNVAFQTEDLDTYDFDCDDISNAQAVLMANISNYGSDVISEVPHFETYLNDMVNQEFFENNDLKAQLQDKDNTICMLKDMIKSMREKSKDENIKYDYCEIEIKNVELENSVAKLLSENECLCNEINYVKQNDDLKAQIQDKVFVITSLKNNLRKLKGKEIVDIVAQIPSANNIVLGMFKLDLEPLAPRLLQNREAHINYFTYTQEQADILQKIVEQAKVEQPLDKELDFSCKYAQRIQELLLYIQDTCPNAINLSAKKVAVTPKNKVKKVRLKCSTSKSGSKPTSNKRNDRISQTPSRNMKNKVEAQPRKVNKKNRVVEPICDDNVKIHC
ncbi:hypothetical protein Tco_0971307 [Tanacetum coccineum]